MPQNTGSFASVCASLLPPASTSTGHGPLETPSGSIPDKLGSAVSFPRNTRTRGQDIASPANPAAKLLIPIVPLPVVLIAEIVPPLTVLDPSTLSSSSSSLDQTSLNQSSSSQSAPTMDAQLASLNIPATGSEAGLAIPFIVSSQNNPPDAAGGKTAGDETGLTLSALSDNSGSAPLVDPTPPQNSPAPLNTLTDGPAPETATASGTIDTVSQTTGSSGPFGPSFSNGDALPREVPLPPTNATASTKVAAAVLAQNAAVQNSASNVSTRIPSGYSEAAVGLATLTASGSNSSNGDAPPPRIRPQPAATTASESPAGAPAENAVQRNSTTSASISISSGFSAGVGLAALTAAASSFSIGDAAPPGIRPQSPATASVVGKTTPAESAVQQDSAPGTASSIPNGPTETASPISVIPTLPGSSLPSAAETSAPSMPTIPVAAASTAVNQLQGTQVKVTRAQETQAQVMQAQVTQPTQPPPPVQPEIVLSPTFMSPIENPPAMSPNQDTTAQSPSGAQPNSGKAGPPKAGNPPAATSPVPQRASETVSAEPVDGLLSSHALTARAAAPSPPTPMFFSSALATPSPGLISNSPPNLPAGPNNQAAQDRQNSLATEAPPQTVSPVANTQSGSASSGSNGGDGDPASSRRTFGFGSEQSLIPASIPVPPNSQPVSVPVDPAPQPVSGQAAAPAPAPNKGNSTTPSGPADSPALSPATGEPRIVPVTGPVQMAQMANHAAQSEMRIGLNTSAFGSVEVRTVVHSSDVGLVIGSEKGDLRSLMAGEIPAITNTLQQHNLRLNQVDFSQGSAFSGGSPSGSDAQRRWFAPGSPATHSAHVPAGAEDSSEPRATERPGGRHQGLNILA
jgi:hypothetical protein